MNYTQELQTKTIKNCKDILLTNFKVTEDINTNKVLIIYDHGSSLSKLLSLGFENASKELNIEPGMIKFNFENHESIVNEIKENYSEGDTIILIQTSSFRVSKYRWRKELCDIGFKVAEFAQLGKMLDNEVEPFINALTTDFDHYNSVSNNLVPRLESTSNIKIISTDGSVLKYSGKMDKVIKNTGELWGKKSWSSRYPIGEIITEALDLKDLNGELQAYAFPDFKAQETTFVEPFKCTIKNGFLISHNGPKEFNELVELIKTENEDSLVYVREFGLGLNRNIKRFGRLGDPQSYERVEGMHFSLGMKHGIYHKKLAKKFGKKFFQRFHIDIYVNLDKMYVDDQLVYTQEHGYLTN